MEILALTSAELVKINTLLEELKQQYQTAHEAQFLNKVSYHASFLPQRLRELYSKLKHDHRYHGMTVVHGLPVSITEQTPSSWDYADSYQPNLDADFFGMLICSLVGHPFGWATQQKGKIIHDLIPQIGKGEAQTGYGSSSELELHTEDSFHEFKADFVCMYGIRNEQQVPTTFVSVRELSIHKTLFTALFGEYIELLPDESHLDEQQIAVDAQHNMVNEGQKVQVLYGDREYPYLTYDSAYTNYDNLSGNKLEAYQQLKQLVESNTMGYALRPGDFCVIDNRKVLHGRRPFTPNFDGHDRWLKRINITANLRKSAQSRKSLSSRIIE